MFAALSKLLLFVTILFASYACVPAQIEPIGPPSGRNDSKEDQPRTFREMLSKQRVEREKKDHEEMLKRGEDAALLSAQLENAFEKTNQLSRQDQQKLEALASIVLKIRKELGGGDDDDEDDNADVVKERRPATLREAVDNLKATTLKLDDDLKHTSRFTISAVAIQSSNTVLRLVRFLQLRK